MWPNRKVIGGTYAPTDGGGPTPPFDLGPDIPASIRQLNTVGNRDFVSIEPPGLNGISYEIDVADDNSTLIIYCASIATNDDGPPYEDAMLGASFGEVMTRRQQGRLWTLAWRFTGVASGSQPVEIINNGISGALAAVATFQAVDELDTILFESGNSLTDVSRLQPVGATGATQLIGVSTRNTYQAPTAEQAAVPLTLIRDLWIALGEFQVGQVWTLDAGWLNAGGTYIHTGATPTKMVTPYSADGGLGFFGQVSIEAGALFRVELVLSDARIETFDYPGPLTAIVIDMGRAKAGDPLNYTEIRFWGTGNVSVTGPVLMSDPVKVGLALWSKTAPTVADPAILIEWERISDAVVFNSIHGIA